MLTAKFDNHFGYAPYERTNSANARNGKKQKIIRSKYCEIPIEVPHDRNGTFEPQIVKKRQKNISSIEDIYGFEVSDGMVSDITD